MNKTKILPAGAVEGTSAKTRRKDSRFWYADVEECAQCATFRTAHPDGFYPSHTGSPNCRSGSIAAGEDRAHCTCDTCF